MMNDDAIRSLLDRYPQLIEDCERHRDVGWYPSGGEVYKFTYRPSFEAVDRFADHVFGGIGYEGHDYMVGPTDFGVDGYGRRRPSVEGEALARHRQMFDHALRTQCQEIAGINPHRLVDWVRLAGEEYDFGGITLPVYVNRLRTFSTFHAVRVARRSIVVSELLRARRHDVATLVEIGGGHGRALRDLIWTLDVETAFYVDLPLNMLLAARFLGHFFKDRLNLVWSEEDAIVEGGINIVAPWQIDRIDVPIDLLVNFLSLQHMSMEALRFYGERLIEPRVKILYHENRDRPREGFDVGAGDYPFRSPFSTEDAKEIFVSRSPADGRILGRILGELLIRK